MNTYHKAVMVSEVVCYLALKPDGIYVDATFGGGGHTQAILQAEPSCRVVAFDWDEQALELNGPPLQEQFKDRLQLIWGNFAHIDRLLKKYGVRHVDGVLADFGTSQYQIQERAGFSFSHDTPLDMRMSPAHQRVTAQEVVNNADEITLARIFYEYGEERKARALACRIVSERSTKPIRTTGELAALVSGVIKGSPRGIHPATKVFQALRMYVNDELNNIKAFLLGSSKMLKLGGRLVCISFHSLEDRLVKNFFRSHNEHYKILTPKVITPTEDEVRANRSARSAKLRAAELIKLFN